MSKMTAEQVEAMLIEKADDIADKSDGRKNEVGGWGYAAGVLFAVNAIRDHLIETDEQRRERFESWHRKRYGPSFDHMLAPARDGYANGGTNMMWLAFQAALTWRGETKGGET